MNRPHNNKHKNMNTSTYQPPSFEATRSPGICQEIENMEKVVAELHETISGLESRLQPVVRPMNPAPETATCGRGVEREIQSGMLEKVQRHLNAIRGASARLQDLHSRVDL